MLATAQDPGLVTHLEWLHKACSEPRRASQAPHTPDIHSTFSNFFYHPSLYVCLPHAQQLSFSLATPFNVEKALSTL